MTSLTLFGIQLHLYGLIVGTALAVGYWLISHILHRHDGGISADPYFAPTLIIGLIGARAYHLITDWSLYEQQPWTSWLAISQGGIGLIGGLIGGLLAVWLVASWRREKQFIVSIIEAVAIAAPLAQSIGRWGNFVNQELFGKPTQLPWAIVIKPENRPQELQQFETFHPLFLYESLLNLTVFALLWYLYRSRRWEIGSGRFLSCYMIAYGGIRFGLEFLRIETARPSGVFSVLSIAQWVSLVMICIGGLIWVRDRR